MKNIQKIRTEIQASIDVKQKVLENESTVSEISDIAELMTSTIKNGGKVLICGNGGSASDALHIAGEIVGRFQKERKAFAAVALNADVATMTAIANDYGYDQVFSRQVEGIMTDKDVLMGISTSGNSQNIITAFEMAHSIGGKTILMSGRDGGKLRAMADKSFIAPCDVTAHIQEAHECVFHIICGIVEENLL